MLAKTTIVTLKVYDSNRKRLNTVHVCPFNFFFMAPCTYTKLRNMFKID